ncbi:hypothetical protein OG21DRAFT_951948 [Imleria badia]|nr:hypothetical protein OG21DRAFT_951948 [Imleria badia]
MEILTVEGGMWRILSLKPSRHRNTPQKKQCGLTRSNCSLFYKSTIAPPTRCDFCARSWTNITPYTSTQTNAHGGRKRNTGLTWNCAGSCENKGWSFLSFLQLVISSYRSIFERLKQHGYEPEIAYFGHYAIQHFHRSFFKTCKPLSKIEWTRMWPEWLETMNDFRSQRLDEAVYQPRRDLLMSEYLNYVTCPSPDTPTFDLLPHVIELSCFPLFRNVIKVPEGTEMGAKPFESAFSQLPVFVDDWRRQLDVELAELVKIPSYLSFKDASGGQGVALSGATCVESSQVPTDKLRLACAVFNTSSTLAHHPDVYSTMLHYPNPIGGAAEWERTMPIQKRFSVKFLEDAPYIVYACGLDPNVATVEDMDCRNARFKCLTCGGDSFIRTWRDSLRHALWAHHMRQSRLESPNWQIVSDEYIDAIQTAELSVTTEFRTSARCLLCRHRVGDSVPSGDIMHHLVEQ